MGLNREQTEAMERVITFLARLKFKATDIRLEKGGLITVADSADWHLTNINRAFYPDRNGQ